MISAGFDAAFQASWPAAEYADAGGLRVGRGLGGGHRVSAARVVTRWQADDLDAAFDIHRRWDQPPLFAVEDADQVLSQALELRGLRPFRRTVLMQAPVAALADRPIPPVSALPVWPPLAIQRDLWTELGIGAERQAVMQRVELPRAAILGRVKDRAAGCAFVATHGTVAMLHALAVVPALRRHGVAGWLTRRAAELGAAAGAERLALAVLRENGSALALYDRMGFTEIGGYSYWAPPEG